MDVLLDWRFVTSIVWAGGMIVAFGKVFSDRYGQHRIHHDRRSIREVVIAVALFLTAVVAALSVVVILYGPTGTGLDRLACALAFGAFGATGVVMATARKDRPR